MIARRVVGSEHLRHPGDFSYALAGDKPIGMAFLCPGCGRTVTVHFGVDEASNRHWIWDEDLDDPTLTPDIREPTCGWHGFLRSGQWMSYLETAADEEEP